jgi:hypothetical protein
VYLGNRTHEGASDEVGLFMPDRLAHQADGDPERRPALADCHAFQADDSIYSRNTMADLCGISGSGTVPAGANATCSTRASSTPVGRTPV